jgi:hypothetical protein
MSEPAKIYVFRTSLTTEQVTKALESSMDESQLDFIFNIIVVGDLPFIGNVDKDECRLMRRPRFFSNDYAGIFTARISREQDETRLDGHFDRVRFGFPGGGRHSKAVDVSSIKIMVMISAIAEGYFIIASFFESDRALAYIPVVFFGLAFILICTSYWFALRTQRRQREFVLNHVKTVLQASLAAIEEAG